MTRRFRHAMPLMLLVAAVASASACGGDPASPRGAPTDSTEIDAGDSTDADSTGTDTTGTDSTGTDSTGTDSTGTDSTGTDTTQADGPRLLHVLDTAALQLPAPPAGSLPVRIGYFVTVHDTTPTTPWEPAEAIPDIRGTIVGANDVLVQCNLHLVPETVRIVALPRRLIAIEGNRPGSWGGHPPDSVTHPDRFMYDQHERLTAETRELFGFGKRFTTPNAIAAFTVIHIEYWIGDEYHPPGGLSFPPNSYHHADDYPHRNSVLLHGYYDAFGVLPKGAMGRLFAHELGHMLLNSGSHDTETGNLMRDGAALRAEQCTRMRDNRARLYGEAAVVDPGRP